MASKYNYLKKRALYDLALSYLDDVPVSSKCDYHCRRGFESLTFYPGEKTVRFSVMNGGAWIGVAERDGDGCIIRHEVLKRI